MTKTAQHRQRAIPASKRGAVKTLPEFDRGDSQIVLYQAAGGEVRLDVRLDRDTVWLTQAQMAELFVRERSVITKHLRNVFGEGELEAESNVQNLHIPNSDKPVAFYNLDVIISVGYRVRSPQGTRFRQWATRLLRELKIVTELTQRRRGRVFSYRRYVKLLNAGLEPADK